MLHDPGLLLETRGGNERAGRKLNETADFLLSSDSLIPLIDPSYGLDFGRRQQKNSSDWICVSNEANLCFTFGLNHKINLILT